jgi:beta-phosphoglucomutase-like phosphatase (HAD superfamily)
MAEGNQLMQEVQKQGDAVPKAILAELETLAVNGRQVSYDVLESVLSDKGVKLSPAQFSRRCVDRPVADAIADLLHSAGKKVASEDKLVEEVVQGTRLSLADGSVGSKIGIKSLLRVAAERQVQVGLLGLHDEKTGAQIAGKLGASAGDSEVATVSSDARGCPTPDAWLKLAKQLGVSPGGCLAVTTSSASCKSALSAGMRCVVVPDAFTEFQDYGGADRVLDALDDAGVESILELLAD